MILLVLNLLYFRSVYFITMKWWCSYICGFINDNMVANLFLPRSDYQWKLSKWYVLEQFFHAILERSYGYCIPPPTCPSPFLKIHSCSAKTNLRNCYKEIVSFYVFPPRSLSLSLCQSHLVFRKNFLVEQLHCPCFCLSLSRRVSEKTFLLNSSIAHVFVYCMLL